MPHWLADPFCCLAKARQPDIVDHRTACAVLTHKEGQQVRPTRAVRSEERDGTRWSWGHLYAARQEDKEHGTQIWLGVNNSGHHSIETPPLLPAGALAAADLLRAAVANSGGHACGGKTILEYLWEHLDAIVERMMAGAANEDGLDGGRAEGIAWCIAVFQNPYLPSTDAVRAEAMERWEAGQDEEDEKAVTRADDRRTSRRRK